jgi:uncharacterized protein YodC (DUF2158 family)
LQRRAAVARLAHNQKVAGSIPAGATGFSWERKGLAVMQGFFYLVENNNIMADQFKEGDVVVLKSGGPKMTVNEVYLNGNLNCIYFDKEQNYKVKDFKPDSVKKDTDTDDVISIA